MEDTDDPLLLDMDDPLRPEEDVDCPQLPSARVPKDTGNPMHFFKLHIESHFCPNNELFILLGVLVATGCLCLVIRPVCKSLRFQMHTFVM